MESKSIVAFHFNRRLAFSGQPLLNAMYSGDKAMNRKPHFSERKADLLSRL
jgi:hypothetical protein